MEYLNERSHTRKGVQRRVEAKPKKSNFFRRSWATKVAPATAPRSAEKKEAKLGDFSRTSFFCYAPPPIGGVYAPIVELIKWRAAAPRSGRRGAWGGATAPRFATLPDPSPQGRDGSETLRNKVGDSKKNGATWVAQLSPQFLELSHCIPYREWFHSREGV